MFFNLDIWFECYYMGVNNEMWCLFEKVREIDRN